MQNSNETVIINSRKYDGTIHKTWTADLIERKGTMITLIGKFDKEIKHSHLGIIGRGTISYEFYWLEGWFNIFRFHEPDGSLRNFYCNINMPPKFENNVLNYVDLDIDVLVWKDFTTEILDADEFAENCSKYNYPAKIKNRTNENIKKIMALVRNRDFPFDIKI